MQYERTPHQAAQLPPGLWGHGCGEERAHADQRCSLRVWLAEEFSGARVHLPDHAPLGSGGPGFQQDQAGHPVGQCAEKPPQDEHQGQRGLRGALCVPAWLDQPGTGEPFPVTLP